MGTVSGVVVGQVEGIRSGGRMTNDEDRGNEAWVGVDDQLEWG